MNECSIIYELIQKEIDGDITSRETELINKHCQSCEHCQSLRNDYLQIEELLFSAPLLDPGPDFYTSLINKLEVSPGVKKDFQLSKLTGLIATIAILLSAAMLFISWLILLPLTGFLLSLVNNFWPIYYLVKTLSFIGNLFNIGFDFINNIIQIITPSMLLIMLAVSFVSLIILVKIMVNTRKDYQI